MESIYKLKNIRLRHGARTVLNIPRLSFAEGKVYALAGDNGAGKSTLLQLLALLHKPEEGDVLIAGEPVHRSKATLNYWRRHITLVEQNPYLFDRSVYQNLAFGLNVRGIGGSERSDRIAQALAEVGLEGFEKRRARELSGGEIQRVALARALALKPTVLLLDEPSSNIDRQSLQVFEQLVAKLPQQGITVMFSTHDMLQVRRMGASMIRLQNGEVESGDRPCIDIVQGNLQEGYYESAF